MLHNVEASVIDKEVEKCGSDETADSSQGTMEEDNNPIKSTESTTSTSVSIVIYVVYQVE